MRANINGVAAAGAQEKIRKDWSHRVAVPVRDEKVTTLARSYHGPSGAPSGFLPAKQSCFEESQPAKHH
jgi:hypothetical protein